MGLLESTTAGGYGVGFLLAGAITALTSVRVTFAATAVGVILATILMATLLRGAPASRADARRRRRRSRRARRAISRPVGGAGSSSRTTTHACAIQCCDPVHAEGVEPWPQPPPPSDARFYHPIQRDRATFLEPARRRGGGGRWSARGRAGGGHADRHRAFAERFRSSRARRARRRPATRGRAIRTAPSAACTTSQRTGEPVTATLEPGSLGFERAIQIAYGLAEDGRVNKKGVPRNLMHLGLLAEMADSQLDRRPARDRAGAARARPPRPAQGRRPRAHRALLRLVTQVTSRRRPLSTS